jgi:hypothetical protein
LEAVAGSDRSAVREHEGRHTIEMERRVAEVALERPRATHPQVQILFPGVADRTVHLQRDARGEARRLVAASFACETSTARAQSPVAIECAAL